MLALLLSISCIVWGFQIVWSSWVIAVAAERNFNQVDTCLDFWAHVAKMFSPIAELILQNGKTG